MFLVLLLGTTFQLDLAQNKHLTLVTLEKLWGKTKQQYRQKNSLTGYCWGELIIIGENAHICDTDCIRRLETYKMHTVYYKLYTSGKHFHYSSVSVAHQLLILV